MSEYEINENTMALIACSKGQTLVYEETDTFFVEKSTNKIMEDSCEYFGSSLEGRQKGSFKLIGITHKVPVIVEETKNLIFFPTSSPRLTDCSWISLKHVNKIQRKESSKNLIIFKNKQELELNLSYGIINNQLLRASRLEIVLQERKKQ